MRKLSREILRRRAEKLGVKASRYVSVQWDIIQKKRWGAHVRALHIQRGTKPKRKWA